MIAKILMKKPVLMIGLLMMIIFIYDLRNRGILFDRDDRLKTTSCTATLVMLNKRTPATWRNECEGNNLAVTIDINLESKKIDTQDDTKVKTYMFRELANDLVFIAKNSPVDSLERVFMVRVKLQSERMDIDALSEGKYINKLRTLTNRRFIAEHLQNTVKIKETMKQ